MKITKSDLLLQFTQNNIEFDIYDHDALYTVEDSIKLRGEIEGAHTKNLFLKNKKNNFYLFSCEENSIVNLKQLSKKINAKNLSFAKEEYLLKYLGIRPGSVSPYSLLNDKENKISFYLEDRLYESKKINFHPLINTATITLSTSDFVEFMIENKKKINIFSLQDYKLIKTL